MMEHAPQGSDPVRLTLELTESEGRWTAKCLETGDESLPQRYWDWAVLDVLNKLATRRIRGQTIPQCTCATCMRPESVIYVTETNGNRYCPFWDKFTPANGYCHAWQAPEVPA